jgi:hypothetical protein
MSNVVLNSSLLAEMAQSFSPAEQLKADLNQLAQDLKSGNLPALQQDYVTLSRDLADTANSGSVPAAESGVIVSLITELASLPISPAEEPGQFVPRPAGFNYGDPLFEHSGPAQNGASSMGSIATNSASSAGVGTAPQNGVSSFATPPGAAQSAEPATANARPPQAVDVAFVSNADSQRASNAAGSPGLSIPDQEGQAAAAASVGASFARGNPLIPGLNPEPSVVFPWNLFDWQLSGYRSQSIPAAFHRKRKSPRGSAARTRTRRRKP